VWSHGDAKLSLSMLLRPVKDICTSGFAIFRTSVLLDGICRIACKFDYFWAVSERSIPIISCLRSTHKKAWELVPQLSQESKQLFDATFKQSPNITNPAI